MLVEQNEITPRRADETNARQQPLCFLELVQSLRATAGSSPPESQATDNNSTPPNVEVRALLTSATARPYTAREIEALSREEIQRLPDNTFSAMSPAEFGALAPGMLVQLRREQWDQLSPAHVQTLTREQIRFIYPWNTSSLPVAHFTEAQLAHLAEDQRDRLTSTQLDQIGRDRLRHLFDNNIPAAANVATRLAPSDIRLIPESLVTSVFPPESLPHILPGQLSALSVPQLRALLCNRKNADTPIPERINQLSCSQIHAIQMRHGRAVLGDSLYRALDERARATDGFDY